MTTFRDKAPLAVPTIPPDSVLVQTLHRIVGPDRAKRLPTVLVVPPGLLAERGSQLSRAAIAEILNILLFEDLMNRVPAAQRYFDRSISMGRPFVHDHGAVRTVAMEGMGSLPAGQEAIVRILRPLGYQQRGHYPLERLKMTGRSYAQSDYPEAIAQFFISELHPERFSPQFQAAVARVTATSRDPLTDEAKSLLDKVERDRFLSVEEAALLLPVLVRCFAKQHDDPTEQDYEALLAESAEMAWISTEGNAFNHVTDRVDDVEALAAELRAMGEPIKDVVEHSQSDRVQQTAFRAAQVQRTFRTADGRTTTRTVPGSFLEFITRLPMPADSPEAGHLDLGFDSSNAQAIFKMTAGAGAP